MIGRRDFLRRLLVGAAGAAIGAELDIERLLWVPKPIITVPGIGAVAGELDAINWLTMEALRLLKNELSIATCFNRSYDDTYVIGQTLQVPMPSRLRAA